MLGGAGQRILTAGEILCLAGATAGLHATQKNDYPITVMRGHSVSEMILDEREIGYTGIENPSVVVALAKEGVDRRKKMFADLSEDALVLVAAGVEAPPTQARVETVDFKALKLKSQDWALAALAGLAQQRRILTPEMLRSALRLRFKGKVLEGAGAVVEAMRGFKNGAPL